jgi:Cu-Zn family superoxide dismutase
VVIHKGEDDLGLGFNKESKITGNAGARMACAIIGLSHYGPLG